MRYRCRRRNLKKNIEDSQNYSGAVLPLSGHEKLRGRKLKHVESLCGWACGPLAGVRRDEGLELWHEAHAFCWCSPEIYEEGDYAIVVHRPPSDADA